MCGIVGIFKLNGDPVAQQEVKRMTDAVAHRGPDGEGIYIDNNVGLGHRRLSHHF
jgi:asparagine synthase (glutamine-hydrolysing)